MHCIAAKFAPQLLANDQKRRRVNVRLELREKANEDPTFISRIITGDESWIFFPKLKMKLMGKRFETVPAIQRELQAVLYSIKENDFHGAFEAGKNDGIAVYLPKEVILKEMAARIESVKPAFLF
jgi:hypothetical protein